MNSFLKLQYMAQLANRDNLKAFHKWRILEKIIHYINYGILSPFNQGHLSGRRKAYKFYKSIPKKTLKMFKDIKYLHV